MKKSKIIVISIVLILFLIPILHINVFNSNVYAVNPGYSVEGESEGVKYTVKFGDVNYGDDEIDVEVTFVDQNIADDVVLSNGWTKVDSKTIKAKKKPCAHYIINTINMEDGKKPVVRIITPFEMKKGETLNIEGNDVTQNYENISIESNNSDVVKIGENNEIIAVGKGIATLTVNATEKTSKETGTLTVKVSVINDSTESDAWYISLNNTKLKMQTGDSEDIIVNVKLKDGYEPLQEAKKIFTVDWEMKDESIAKLTTTDGEEMTDGGIAGGAKIEALKEGETELSVTIKTESSVIETATIPITVTKESDDTDEVPVYNISLSENSMEMNVKNSKQINVKATLDGESASSNVLKDEFDVEWEIENQSIAKCNVIPKQNITSDGIVGSAYIEGLKSGSTNLLITVTAKDNAPIKFTVPITINANDNDGSGENERKNDEKNHGQNNNPTKDDKSNNKNDQTTANKKLPQTGESYYIIFAIMGLGVISIIIGFKKMRK